MTIDSPADFKKILVLCRQYGVNVLKINGIEMVLEGIPQYKEPRLKAINPTLAPGGITEDTKIDTPDALTAEQLLFYSAGG